MMCLRTKAASGYALIVLTAMIGLAIPAANGQQPGASFRQQQADKTDWVGTWADGDNQIELVEDGDIIVAEGQAYYPKLNHAPWPKLGEFEGGAKPSNGRLEIIHAGDGQVYCHVIMERRKDTLVVINHDSRCGGANVSFKGTYRRLEDIGRALRADLDRVAIGRGLTADISFVARKHLPDGMLMSQAKVILESAGLQVADPWQPSKTPRKLMKATRTDPAPGVSTIQSSSVSITIHPKDPKSPDLEIGEVKAVMGRQSL